ncbi:MAG: TlpA family protein disulfide reductase [Pyrinomonadaceae bacterium]|nr:TlpA family protein disulfide reductase [Pyrinomonadaceae bacterium]
MLFVQYVRVILTSLLGFILLTPIGMVGNNYRALIGSLFYFLHIVYFARVNARKLSTTGIVISALVGQNLLMIGYIVKYFDGEIYALPLTSSFLLGTLAGGLFAVSRSPVRYFVLACLLVCSAWIFLYGWGYNLHKLNFGTFTGRIEPFPLESSFQIEAASGSMLSNQDFDGKFTVFDFWTTKCGVCFEKFPLLENAYLQYEDNSDVVIYAVNVPTDGDLPESALSAIRKRGFRFPVAKAVKPENSSDLLGVRVYPTIFVVDSNLRVVYKGEIEGAIEEVHRLSQR